MELSAGPGEAAHFIATVGALDSAFVLVDVGVRDGIHQRWLPLEPVMQVYGFDAIAEVSAPNERHHYFKLALGTYDGECLFVVPNDVYQAQMSPEGTHKVPIARLDTLWADGALPPADFIKIDVEGYEPEVLAGASEYLKASNLLGADIETHFHTTPLHPMTHFAAINKSLVEHRLLVADFAFARAHAGSWTGICNVLFGRHLLNERHHAEFYPLRSAEANPSADVILKSIALLDVYGLYGPAAALTREFRDVILKRIDADRLTKIVMASLDLVKA